MWLLVFFIYCIFSQLIVDSSAFLSFEFYRRDGNYFIAMMPLLAISNICIKINTVRLLENYILFITFINTLVFAIFLLNGGNLVYPSHFYTLGFSTHNAAGGFLMIISCLSVFYFLGKKTLPSFFALILNVITLFHTGSRGSYVGFILAIALVLLIHFKLIYIYRFLWIGFISSFILILSIGIELNRFYTKNDLYAQGIVDLPLRHSHNITHRLIKVWPWAWQEFMSSPIYGKGLSTFNDKTVLENVKYEFAGLRILKKNTFNSGHAHNSYLHILAELGFLGLILIFCILCEVNSMIKKLPNYERLLLTSCLFAMIISSFTEHRLTTPSQALPFYFLLSLFYGKRNIYNKQNMDGLKNSYV